MVFVKGREERGARRKGGGREGDGGGTEGGGRASSTVPPPKESIAAFCKYPATATKQYLSFLTYTPHAFSIHSTKVDIISIVPNNCKALENPQKLSK